MPKKTKRAKLNYSDDRRRAVFINEYLKDFNGTRAAIAAGYSEKTARSEAPRLLANVSIREEVDRRAKERLANLRLDADYVLKHLIEIHDKCSQGVEVLDRQGKPTGEWKFDSKGALRALELIGKHVQMFPDKLELSNDPNNPLPQSVQQVVFYIPENGRGANN